MKTPSSSAPKPGIYAQFLTARGIKLPKRPKPFWYCRTPAGWRYLPDTSAARKYPGRSVIRENVNGKRVYTPVKGGTQSEVHSALSAAYRRVMRPKSATTPVSNALANVVQSYITDRKQNRKFEAAENARLVLAEFTAICPTVQTVKGISVAHLSTFCEALRVKEQSDRTVSNKYNRVRSFLKFAGHDVKMTKDDRPKYERTLPTVYQKSEVDALLKHSDAYMRVALSMGLQLGLREQELMHAEWSDIDREHKTFRVRSKPAYGFKVKDSEERDIPVPSALLTLLDKWSKERKQTDGLILGVGKVNSKPNGHLLRLLQRLAARAGVPDATLHKMRRYYVTTLLRSGAVDLRTVQAFAGHSDLASTMRYLRPASATEMQTKIDFIF